MDTNLAKRLKHRVTLLAEQNTSDGMGGIVEGWVDVATVWGGVEPKTAREFVKAEGISNEVTHVVVIRYLPNVHPDYQVKFGVRQFKVISVINPDERNAYLELVCKEET